MEGEDLLCTHAAMVDLTIITEAEVEASHAMLCEDGNAVQEARHQLKIHCTKVFHKNDTVTCTSRESNDPSLLRLK